MMNSQGGAVAARWVHTPEVAGSNPALATITTPAGRGLFVVCHLLPPTLPGAMLAGDFLLG